MAYTATVTLDKPKVSRLSPGLGLVSGRIALSSYHATLAEITAITKRLKTVHSVISGVSSTGVLSTWIDASKALKCYVPNTGVEVANDVDCGTIDFIAIGSI